MAQRMETSVKRRKMQGGKGNVYLAINSTKVAEVSEVSHMHGAIIGVKYPQHLIPIDITDKIKVRKLLDGKLE